VTDAATSVRRAGNEGNVVAREIIEDLDKFAALADDLAAPDAA
jgi:hypothetical protein